MSILIKGMEMPKGKETATITICSDGLVFQEFKEEPSDVYSAIQLPPHGRLIDADALIAMCKTMEQIEWNNKAAPYSWAYAYESFESDIDDAPTIVEAEESKDG